MGEPQVKRCGIAIDNWKLPLFEKRLREEGYTVVDQQALTTGTMLLTVEVEDGEVAMLQTVIARTNEEAARRKRELHGEE